MDATLLLGPERAFERTTLPGGRLAPHGGGRATPRRRRLAPREHLFFEGTRADDVFELVRGTILLTRSLPGDRRQIVDVIGPGRLFGLTRGALHDCRATAAVETTLTVVDRDAAFRDPRTAERLVQSSLGEVERLRALALLLGRKTALERLASFLVAMVGDPSIVSAELVLPMTRAEIADHLGLTIETVSRNVTRLRRMGLVADRKSGLLLPDCRRLARVAEGLEAADGEPT